MYFATLDWATSNPRSIFGFKPPLRLEWRDQDDQDKT
jgi:hypothetical protein